MALSGKTVTLSLADLTIVMGTIDRATLKEEQAVKVYSSEDREKLYKNSPLYRTLLESQQILANAYRESKDATD